MGAGAEVRFEEWAPVAGADDGGVLLADVEISTALECSHASARSTRSGEAAIRCLE